jgi:hypothetical protein
VYVFVCSVTTLPGRDFSAFRKWRVQENTLGLCQACLASVRARSGELIYVRGAGLNDVSISFPTCANQPIFYDDSTMHLQFVALLAFAGLGFATLNPNYTSNAGVEIYNPSSFFDTTGPWSLMSQAGDYLYIAGALRHS